MFTPYDWQEAIGHRAQFVESKLAFGTPVIAASFDVGVLMLTYRRQARKIFEVYDRIVVGAIGQQSDVEMIRISAIDFAHQEGYTHSEQDVTLQRLVNALSGPVKRAFADFSSPPVVASCLFAEVCKAPDGDSFAVLEYDGDFNISKGWAVVAPEANLTKAFAERLAELKTKGVKLEPGLRAMEKLWKEAIESASHQPGSEIFEELTLETAVLERNPKGENRFRHLGDLK
jgi:proteasome alpha subunit